MKLSDGEKLELANWAKEVREHPNFKRLISGLLVENMERLVKSNVGSTEATVIHAEMKGLEAFQGALTVLINDGVMIRDKAK